MSYQYLTFVLEDDEELEQIRVDYTSGKLLTGELKAKCIKELQAYVKGFQERRAKVTDDVVRDFMAAKKLEWRGNPNSVVGAKEGGGASGDAEPSVDSVEGAPKLTKNQEKKLAKLKAIEEKKAAAKAASSS